MGIEIKGLDKLLKDLNKLPQDLERQIELILEDNVRQLARSAQRFAPVDTGELRQSIKSAQNGKLEWRVVVLAKHGPYIEFGTGGLVQVPEELVDLALQFRGSGIRRVDLRPQPFLYPAFELQRDVYIRDLKDLLETETKKI